MRLEIITPEQEIFKGDADAVQLPGLDGSFQVLNGHAPIISGLTAGTLKIDLPVPFDSGEKSSDLIEKDKSNARIIRVPIKGGVVEMFNNKLIILAE
ncbi:MAG: F0F1 ATP synthase subunit epsilon [Cryomorphaceae bacterium]|jgi:F-type H+-transporting ATPase subunit epsilon|nr:F0F1 ATP synthase subunit epsilon [Cryomorphaceae bacterium]